MRTNTVSVIASLLATVVVTLAQTGCGSSDGTAPTADADPSNQSVADASPATDDSSAPDPAQIVAGAATTKTPASLPKVDLHPEVIISTDAGDIRVRLDAEKAPLTTENFLGNYVYRDFYPGTIFHYVEKDYMVAAGGYTADLKPKDTRAFLKSEADNGLKNKRGTIAMTRLPDHPDSATSQFFINLVDNPELDHKEAATAEVAASDEATQDESGYCVFGEVVEGMEVAEKIAEVPVTNKDAFSNTPVEPIAIRSIELVR